MDIKNFFYTPITQTNGDPMHILLTKDNSIYLCHDDEDRTEHELEKPGLYSIRFREALAYGEIYDCDIYSQEGKLLDKWQRDPDL